jgi:membrane fusion protein, multidrug efflux system
VKRPTLILLALVAFATACKKSAPPPLVAPPPRVEVAAAHRERVAPTVDLTGEVQPVSSVKLLTQAAGTVTDLRVEEGDRVTAGQLLAVIDEATPRAQAARAEAAAQLARATHKQLTVQLGYADKERERMEKLHEGKVVDDRALETARSQADGLRAQVDVAAAQIRQSDADVQAARVMLANCRIVAPMAGVVTRRSVRLHQYVEKAKDALEILDTSAMELTTNLPADLARGLHPKDPLVFRVGGDTGKAYQGEVVAVIPELDPVSRTLRVKARIGNPAGELVAGMFAVAHVPAGEPRDALVVPRTAIHGEGDNGFVWVIRDGAAVRAGVRPGVRSGEAVEIAGEVKEGERVVTAGADALKPGDRVDIAGQGGG